MREDLSKFRCKYLELHEIQAKTDEILDEYGIDPDEVPPDIELLIDDVGLKIDIRSLEYKYDAYLKVNKKEIVVNSLRYNDERYYNRLKFSLAHELGHFILHGNTMEFFTFDSLDDYLYFKENIPDKQYGRFEWQANEFAGQLLMNEKVLKKKLDEYMTDTWNTDPVNKIAYLANFFQVSEDAMTRRLISFFK